MARGFGNTVMLHAATYTKKVAYIHVHITKCVIGTYNYANLHAKYKQNLDTIQ